MYLLSTYDSVFYDINTLIFKVKYSFVIFVKNFNSYEPKEQKMIIKSFKQTLQSIIMQINSNL